MKYNPDFTHYIRIYTIVTVLALCEKTIMSVLHDQPLILTKHDLAYYTVLSISFMAAGCYMSRRNKE